MEQNTNDLAKFGYRELEETIKLLTRYLDNTDILGDGVKVEFNMYSGLIIAARINCLKSKNQEWITKHEDRLKELIDLLPHGSGIDGETSIDLEESTGEKVIIDMSFHHMDESGFYDGWTSHELKILPSLQHGFVLKISGDNKNDIKTYLYDIFSMALDQDIKE